MKVFRTVFVIWLSLFGILVALLFFKNAEKTKLYKKFKKFIEYYEDDEED
jgi:hypothetical protein